MTRPTVLISIFSLLILSSMLTAQQKEKTSVNMNGIYSFTMKTIDGKDKPLADYKGKVLLVVNVASFCGYTPQYKDLEEVYRTYKDKGLVILGFPANNFGQQEPGSDEEIKTFCDTKYNVTFDLFSKISVKGDDQHPLYQYITKDSPFPGAVKWNFQKYLVDQYGNIVAMYPSKVKPTDKEVIQQIESLLNDQS
ncbi:MAG: glutathione peroxidase [Ignavibacteriales bacterium]|nr:glutathione peroxidase [Ignavibacteriales bacterium]